MYTMNLRSAASIIFLNHAMLQTVNANTPDSKVHVANMGPIWVL